MRTRAETIRARSRAYGTLLISNGPRHLAGSVLFLGTAIDSEADGQPASAGSGDDDRGIDDQDGIILSQKALVEGFRSDGAQKAGQNQH